MVLCIDSPIIQLQMIRGSNRFKVILPQPPGKLTYLGSQTQTDITFSNNAPTRIAFKSIIRVLQYLAGEMMRPIMYPRKTFLGSLTVTWYATPEQAIDLKVTHVPNFFANAELA